MKEKGIRLPMGAEQSVNRRALRRTATRGFPGNKFPVWEGEKNRWRCGKGFGEAAALPIPPELLIPAPGKRRREFS